MKVMVDFCSLLMLNSIIINIIITIIIIIIIIAVKSKSQSFLKKRQTVMSTLTLAVSQHVIYFNLGSFTAQSTFCSDEGQRTCSRAALSMLSL